MIPTWLASRSLYDPPEGAENDFVIPLVLAVDLDGTTDDHLAFPGPKAVHPAAGAPRRLQRSRCSILGVMQRDGGSNAPVVNKKLNAESCETLLTRKLMP